MLENYKKRGGSCPLLFITKCFHCYKFNTLCSFISIAMASTSSFFYLSRLHFSLNLFPYNSTLAFSNKPISRSLSKAQFSSFLLFIKSLSPQKPSKNYLHNSTLFSQLWRLLNFPFVWNSSPDHPFYHGHRQ